MTLATHAIIGASAATALSFNPPLAIAAAFLSHFAIDAIPHWDYIPRSFRRDPENKLNNDMVIGRDFVFDLFKIGADALFGIALALLIFWPQESRQLWIVLLGAGFGILPDPLQFLYWKFRREPILSLQRFHLWVHSNNESLKTSWKLGVLYQLLLISVVVLLALRLSS